MRYRYSANIVNNNLPWPEVSFNTETQRIKDTEKKSPSEAQCLLNRQTRVFEIQKLSWVGLTFDGWLW